MQAMIRRFEDHEPDIADDAHVDPAATVIGDVRIEANASVWPGAVLRGDHGKIVLEEGANVQDNATLHEGASIGPRATVGHNAIVHSADVGRRALVGMGAIVLDGSSIGAESVVAANSVVTEDSTIPESVLAVGAPASVETELEETPWAQTADHYVALADRYRADSAVLDRESVDLEE